MTRLALIRHGPTRWNREGRIQGRTDEPLDAAARADLRRLHLPLQWQEARVVTSPLARARETANLLTGHRDAEIEPALIEMNWGTFEGCRGADLARDAASGYRHIEDWGEDYAPPGGESPRAVWKRLRPWVQGLRGDTLAISHIGVMRVLLARANGWKFHGPAPFQIKRNRLYILHVSGDALRAETEPLRLEMS